MAGLRFYCLGLNHSIKYTFSYLVECKAVKLETKLTAILPLVANVFSLFTVAVVTAKKFCFVCISDRRKRNLRRRQIDERDNVRFVHHFQQE